MLPYFDLPFDRPESLPAGNYMLATYLAFGVTDQDVLKRAGNFASGQTVGTWLPLPSITREMIETVIRPGLSDAIPCRDRFPDKSVAHSFSAS